MASDLKLRTLPRTLPRTLAKRTSSISTGFLTLEPLRTVFSIAGEISGRHPHHLFSLSLFKGDKRDKWSLTLMWRGFLARTLYDA
jgi:hypothetical protein